MVFRKISKDLKEHALWMWENEFEVGMIEEVLGVSERSLRRWRRNEEDFGSVIPPHNPLQGRPRTLTAEQTYALFARINEDPDLYLSELEEWLAIAHDVALTSRRISQIMSDCGYTFKLLRKQAAERDPMLCANFCNLCDASYTARQLISVDESSKDDRTIYRHYGRAQSGKRAVIDAQFVRGDRWSILPAMTVNGFLDVEIVPGSVDGATFFDFIVDKIVFLFLPGSLQTK